MQQPRIERGFGGSVEALARLLQRMFRASAVHVVIDDRETARTALWQAARGDSEPVQRFELDDAHRAAWLFATPGATWCSTGPVSGSALPVATLAQGSWALTPASLALPSLLKEDREFKTLAAVDFGLANEWQGRILIFDPVDAASAETRVTFLASLSEHITPVLSNVFLLRRLQSRAGAAERARVASELHDGAIQALIGIEMKTETLRRRAERDGPGMLPDIANIQNLLRDEVAALRELMQELRPIELDAPHHLPDLLAVLVERFGRETGVAATFSASADTSRLPLRQAGEIVRIVQEGLVNVRRHSRAQQVVVRLADDGGGWRLTIEDDGQGFPFQGRLAQPELDARWLGPTTIKERARAVGGHVTVESTPGRGASVEVTFHASTN
jgi:signal transduction histidine kinase